jgi:putative SOS response-associated peptidase YedK
MCGRFLLLSAPEAIRKAFRYKEQPNFPARFNIAPTQPIAVVRLFEGQRQFALLRWGLIPGWVKDPRAFSLLINARGESVLEKPAFRSAMRYRRCLIPFDGFYEWKQGGKRKQPHCIRGRSGGPMAFAGLWESWMGPNGEEMETAAIVTTTANLQLAPLHHRMPVILPPEAFDLWLDHRAVDAEAAAALITPAPDDLLEIYPVSDAVNKAVNDSAEMIERVAEISEVDVEEVAPKPRKTAKAKIDDGQASLF